MDAADVDKHDEDAHCDAALAAVQNLGNEKIKCCTYRSAESPEQELRLLPPWLQVIYRTMQQRLIQQRRHNIN